MAREQDRLAAVPPIPVEDEQRPLLASEGRQASHGTIHPGVEESGRSGEMSEEPPLKKLVPIIGGLWLAGFFAALDSTIVATLASPISAAFHSSTLLSWIASGYLIANAAIQPLSGRVTDIFGRKAGVVFACTFFAAGTLICGLAVNAPMMIAGRIIAGIGGGCLNTLNAFITSDLIPLRKRGLWQGYSNLLYGTGLSLGGTFGGFMNDYYNWRWAFYVQVPFIVLAGVLGAVFIDIPVKDTGTNRIKRVDFLGAFTLCSSLVLLLLGLNSGGSLVPWTHPLVLVSLPLSAVFFVLFVVVEDRFAAEPVIPVRLVLHRTVLSGCMTNWFMTMAVFAMFYYIPIFLQTVIGLSSTAVGVRLIPQSVGSAAGSLGAGLIMRSTGRYWWLNVAAQATGLVAVVTIALTFNESLAAWEPFVVLTMVGIAYGATLTVTLLALLAAVGREHQAVITSASYAFRSTGSTIGITIASAVFQNTLRRELWGRFGTEEGAADLIRRIRENVGGVPDLPASWKQGVMDSYEQSLRGVWILVAGLGAMAALSSLFMRQHTLHTKLDRK